MAEKLDIFADLPQIELVECSEPQASGSVEIEDSGTYICQLEFLDDVGQKSHSKIVAIDRNDPSVEVCYNPLVPPGYVTWHRTFTKIIGGELGEYEIDDGTSFVITAERSNIETLAS